MRCCVQLPTERVDAVDEFLTGEAIAEMAAAVEAAGFDGAFVTDHPVPGDRWLAAGGHHALDPFVALTRAAAATTRLRLHTHVVVLGYRNPFLLAKSAASLDVVSGGRLVLGVAAGYLKSEFAALGVPYEERNARADEAIEMLRRAWSEDGLAMEGSCFRAVGNTQRPRPRQRPGPPIWVGGNSRRAIRRAVEQGDGWIPFPAPRSAASHVGTASLESAADLADRIAYARRHAETVGRQAPLEIGFVPFGFGLFDQRPVAPEEFAETAAELRDLGVTWLTVTLPCRSRADYLERVAAFGEDMLPRLPGH